MRLPLVVSAFVSVAALTLIQCVGDDPKAAPSTSDDAGDEGGGGNGDSSVVDAKGMSPDTSVADAKTPVDAAEAGMDAAPHDKQAFVTVGRFNGRFDGAAVGAGGAAAADARCAEAAASAFPGRTFHAWVATTAESASGRIGTGPWYIGATLIGGLTELTTGALKTPLNVTQTGVVLTTADTAWTGAMGNGTLDVGSNCNDWSSIASSDIGDVGTVGGSADVWTIAGGVSCDTLRRLYCFEQ